MAGDGGHPTAALVVLCQDVAATPGGTGRHLVPLLARAEPVLPDFETVLSAQNGETNGLISLHPVVDVLALTAPTAVVVAGHEAQSPVQSRTTSALPGVKGWNFLLPFLVYKLFFSVRRPLVVQTNLTAERLHALFAEVLSGQSTLNKLAAVSNSYTRNASWVVRQVSTEESVAVCRPKGLVSWSAGRMKRLCDVTDDAISLETVTSSSGVVATIGPSAFTVVFGFLFAFPQMLLYPRAVVKRWKQADQADPCKESSTTSAGRRVPDLPERMGAAPAIASNSWAPSVSFSTSAWATRSRASRAATRAA